LGGRRPGVADDNGGLIVVVVLVVAGFLAFTNYGNALWYSLKYKVRMSDVQMDAKPNDCDFMYAPLGDKGCSYKSHVEVYNADGELVAGDGAPKYGTDTNTGKPIISYDGGKNWDWYIGTTVPNAKRKSVRVFWVKE
jgi:hypothetical protein